VADETRDPAAPPEPAEPVEAPEVTAPEPTVSAGRRLRRRVVAVVLLLALVGASAVALQGGLGRRDAAAAKGGLATTGAWFCPHGGGSKWDAWVAVTNPGSAPVQVRITSFDRSGQEVIATTTIPPQRQVFQEVPAEDPSSSTQVEFFGGLIGVSAVVRSNGSTGTLGAERCVAQPHGTWFLQDLPTGPKESSWVVLMNPFAEDATVNVLVRTEKRVIRPGALSPVVVPAGRSISVRMNPFALEAPGETTITAQVTAEIGRVVVGGLASTPAGIRSTPAAAAPGTLWGIPVAEYDGSPHLIVVNPGDERSDLAVVSQGPGGQQLVSGLGGLSLPGQAVRTIDVGGLHDAGLAVQATNRQPILASAVVTLADGVSAVLNGSAAPRRSWLVMPGLPPDGGRSTAIIQNVGRVPVQVQLTAIGAGGPISGFAAGSVTVLPGRTITVRASADGGSPVSVLVRSDRPTLVVSGASFLSTGSGFAYTLGMPLPDTFPFAEPTG
jgi:hypothetical protein